MKLITFYWKVLLSFLTIVCIANSSLAFECPKYPEEMRSDILDKINYSMKVLLKSIDKTDFENNVKSIRDSFYLKYPNADQAMTYFAFSSSFCYAIKRDTSLNEKEATNLLFKFNHAFTQEESKKKIQNDKNIQNKEIVEIKKKMLCQEVLESIITNKNELYEIIDNIRILENKFMEQSAWIEEQINGMREIMSQYSPNHKYYRQARDGIENLTRAQRDEVDPIQRKLYQLSEIANKKELYLEDMRKKSHELGCE